MRRASFELGFERGVPVSLDGERMGLVELIEAVAELGARHGVGIVDHIEDRIVGLKVRDIYEVPAAAIILSAHHDLERLVCTIHQNQFKAQLDRPAGHTWCYAPGLWLGAAALGPRRLHRGGGQRAGDGHDHGMKLYKGAARVITRVAERPVRREPGVVLGVRRAVLAGGLAGVHRAVLAAVADGLAAAEHRRAWITLHPRQKGRQRALEPGSSELTVEQECCVQMARSCDSDDVRPHLPRRELFEREPRQPGVVVVHGCDARTRNVRGVLLLLGLQGRMHLRLQS